MEPLFKANPGELIRAEHWNKLQIKLLEAIEQVSGELRRFRDETTSKLAAPQADKGGQSEAAIDSLKHWVEEELEKSKREAVKLAKEANRQALDDILRTFNELRERVDRLAELAAAAPPSATPSGNVQPAVAKPPMVPPPPPAPRGKVQFFTGGRYDGRSIESGPDRFVKGTNLNSEWYGSLNIADDMMVSIAFADERGALSQHLRGPCPNLQDRLPTSNMTEVRLVSQEVTLYYDHQYEGDTLKLPVGTYGSQELGKFYKQATSMRVPEGMIVQLFEGDDLRGASMTLTSDCISLVPLGWNDRAGSFRVARLEATAYELGGYNMANDRPVGSARTMSLAPGRYCGAELGDLMNKISSLRVPEGLGVYLYQSSNYNIGSANNAFQVITRDCDNLMIYDFNDKVGSVRVERFVVTLFENPQYQGARQTLLCQDRPYSRNQLGELSNRRVRSIEIPEGVFLTVIDSRGNRRILTADTPDLGALGFEETINEVFVERFEAVLYEQPGYRGKELRLLVGNYTDKALGELNNRIGSVRLPPDRLMQVNLFEDGSFSAPLGLIRESQENLGTTFQGTSSLRISATVPAKV